MIRFNRKFLLWRYTVGHQQLLLRSVKTEQERTRIDILFKAVEHVCIPTTIEDLSIDEAEHDSIPASLKPLLHNRSTLAKIFLVSGSHGTGCAIAGALFHFEDDGEYDAPGKFDDSMMVEEAETRAP